MAKQNVKIKDTNTSTSYPNNKKGKKGKKKGKDKFNNKPNQNSSYQTNVDDPGINTNPPSDYYPDPKIQALAAAINLNIRNGSDATPIDGVNVKGVSEAINRMPGVYANPILHVPGKATHPTDPVNEAARSVIDAIRKNINANRDYEMPDVPKYLLAICDIQAWISFLKLIYRTASKYNVLNAYTPLALLRAMHVDTSDINNLKIQLSFYINTLVYRVSNLKIPKDIPILSTWIHDFEEIYVDEDIAKAQFIVNVPQYIWKYVINDEGKSELIPKLYFNDGKLTHTVQDLMDFTEDLLYNIVNDEDFAILTGDMMKTYSSFHEVTGVELNDVIEFTPSTEFLEKWHNAAQFTEFDNSQCQVTGWKITEDTSTNLDPFIVFNPQFKAINLAAFTSQRRGAGARFIDFKSKDVTNDQIINATLWMFTYKILDEEEFEYEFECVNTTLCGKGEIWYYDTNNNLVRNPYWGTVSTHKLSNGRISYSPSDAKTLILLSKWNYAPMTVFNWTLNEIDENDIGYYGMIGDFGNYTLIDKRILTNINTCVMYGQYAINYLLQG